MALAAAKRLQEVDDALRLVDKHRHDQHPEAALPQLTTAVSPLIQDSAAPVWRDRPFQAQRERFLQDTRLACRQVYGDFKALASSLFSAMREGGRIGFERVDWFNGGLFDDDSALPLTRDDIALVREAAARDWAEIDPSIFGTLFERGLDPDKRSQLGARYTDRDKIMLIVEPVIIRPWLAE